MRTSGPSKTGWVRHEVFDSLWRAATAKAPSLNAQGLANTLGAMANMSRVLPEVFGSLCRAAAAELQGSNMQEVAYALWAMSTTSGVLPEVCGSWRARRV